jgi:ribonuclease P protein component
LITRFTFTKEERLCNKVLIDKLFQSKAKTQSYPLKVFVLPLNQPGSCPIQVLITVPKRAFKSAVSRNHLKRLIREAFRKNKHILGDYLVAKQQSWLIGFVYVAMNKVAYHELEEKIKVILKRLKEEDEKASG